MGYDFQPAESIPLSYNSYQAVFPTPPCRSRQCARLQQSSVVPCFVRGSIPIAAPPIRTLVAYSSIGPNVPRRNGAPYTRIMMQRFLLQCQSIELSKAVKPILRAQRLSGILSTGSPPGSHINQGGNLRSFGDSVVGDLNGIQWRRAF